MIDRYSRRVGLANAVGLLARGARGGDASTWARPWCVRPSRRPPRCSAAARRELAGRLLLAVLVWRNGWLSSMITKAAACWSWCLSITNSFITAHLARASSFDVLVLVGEVRMQAVLHTDGILLLKNMRRVWSSELASLFYMWKTASSRSFSRCADRRRRLRAAGMSGAGRRAVLLLLCCWPSGASAAPASQLACT